MRDYVILYINGHRIEVRGSSVFRSLSDFLRCDQRMTGTKVVCAEGDCGSCTVLLGRLKEGRLQHSAVCSCIQYLYQLDCTHVVTVEGLNYDGQLNPVQQAMVECHGAQCGFCTPGFVVAMHQMVEDGQAATDESVRRSLTGNLCRCTGYEPILRAASKVDAAKVRRLAELFPTDNITADLLSHQNEPVRIEDAGKIFFKPTDPKHAAEFRAEHPNCTIITGGTDVGVQINKGMRNPSEVLNTHGLLGMRSIQQTPAHLLIGAGATLSELEMACTKNLPELAGLLEYFGSPLIRNAGTLAGNLANGSPIGDMLPPLFVLNAEIELTGVNGPRRVGINSFYAGYRKTVMAADELITAIRIPLPQPDEIVRFYKVSKRKDLDISSFTASVWMRLNGKLIHEIRIAYGGVGPVVLRLPKTESSLTNQLFTEAAMWQAGETALAEIAPISDVRGSTDYRNRLAENILAKFYHDITGSGGNGHPRKILSDGGVHV